MTVESGAAGSLARTRIERGCCLLGVLRVNTPDTGMRTEDIIVAAIVIAFVKCVRGNVLCFLCSTEVARACRVAGHRKRNPFGGLVCLPWPSARAVTPQGFVRDIVGTTSVSYSTYKHVLSMAYEWVSSRQSFIQSPLRAMDALASVLGGYPGGQRLLHALTCVSEPLVRDKVAAAIATVLSEAGRVENSGELCLLTWQFPHQANHACLTNAVCRPTCAGHCCCRARQL